MRHKKLSIYARRPSSMSIWCTWKMHIYSVNLDAAVREGNEDIRFVSVTLRCISALHPLHKAGTNSNVQQSAYLGYQVRFSDAEMLVIIILGFLTNEHSSLVLSALIDIIYPGVILWCRNIQSIPNACHYSMSNHWLGADETIVMQMGK